MYAILACSAATVAYTASDTTVTGFRVLRIVKWLDPFYVSHDVVSYSIGGDFWARHV